MDYELTIIVPIADTTVQPKMFECNGNMQCFGSWWLLGVKQVLKKLMLIWKKACKKRRYDLYSIIKCKMNIKCPIRNGKSPGNWYVIVFSSFCVHRTCLLHLFDRNSLKWHPYIGWMMVSKEPTKTMAYNIEEWIIFLLKMIKTRDANKCLNADKLKNPFDGMCRHSWFSLFSLHLISSAFSSFSFALSLSRSLRRFHYNDLLQQPRKFFFPFPFTVRANIIQILKLLSEFANESGSQYQIY